MEIRKLSLPGVLLVEPKVHQDPRGYLFESFRADVLSAAGIPAFVQENQSLSTRATLRGLHYQLDRPQGKLVRVLHGAVLDVVVDIRVGSPTFGRWLSEELSAENHRQIYVPPGFAHGFQVLTDVAEAFYKCTDYYSGAADQRGVAWNDPGLNIPWPISEPILSEKDRLLLPLDPARTDLPRY
ncbi:MAG TPA: dTDP-4-dehydrorhamnose 3,5-epimerase [Polyangia bacterium]|nr:dTDP-4-dehydrorhamnose 3,5-epimerase [Polyangia bacterium]